MKIVAIGDTHGRDVWKKIVEKEKDADDIIFIGDYFDSFDIPYKNQMDNFCEILAFKQENHGKVSLLLGNHDFHYISPEERYSGYQSQYAHLIGKIVQEAIDADLITVCRKRDNYIFTHAGITKTWAEKNGVENFNKPGREMWAMLKNCPNIFKFTANSYHDNYGDSITQPPIWVRPEALMSDPFDGCGEEIIQVVGHTKFDGVQIKDKFIFIDCLDYRNEYLIINDGVPSIGTV